jgi:hypothetical protein
VFGIPANLEVDQLRITCGGSGNSVPGFRLDNIQLQTNGTAIGNSDLTQSIADARYVNVTGDTMTGDLAVPDEAYDATAWNGSLEVPTKNAIRDKIESIVTGGAATWGAIVGTLSNQTDLNTALSGKQPLDAELTAIAGLTSAADKGIQFTGSGTAATYDLTPAGKALLDDADAATQRATLGITSSNVKLTESIIIACSDETTAITTGTAKVTFRMPYAFTLSAVRASVTTAPTGSTILIDINESGTTILSTKLMIDASEKTSTTAATAAVISDSSLADDAEITIDFDQVGSTIAGAGVKVYLIGTRT